MAAPAAPRARRVGLLAPMVPELRPLLRRLRLAPSRADPGLHVGRVGAFEAAAALTGIGPGTGAAAAERLLDRFAPDLVLVVGIAGGVGPTLALGEVIAPACVLDLATGVEHRPAPLPGIAPRGLLATSGELVVDGAALAALERRGVVAIDMETAAVAAVCERRGVPWAAFRAVSDRAGATDAPLLALAGPDGSGDLAAVARYLLARPWRVVLLARLARDLRRATSAAARAAADALERLAREDP